MRQILAPLTQTATELADLRPSSAEAMPLSALVIDMDSLVPQDFAVHG